MLAKYGIRVVHQQTNSAQPAHARKGPVKDEEKSGVVNRVNCEECSSYYFGETSKRLMTRMQEHKPAVRRHQTKSRIWAHISETGHVVDFKKANVQAQAKSKGSRLVQEAWLSVQNAFNRSIELHPSFLTLRHKLMTREGCLPGTTATTTTSNPYSLSKNGESYNEEPMFQWTITRSRARIIAARKPPTQNTD